MQLGHGPRSLFCQNSGLSLGVALRPASLQMGYLKKGGDGSLLYSVVNAAEPDADGEWLCSGPFSFWRVRWSDLCPRPVSVTS